MILAVTNFSNQSLNLGLLFTQSPPLFVSLSVAFWRKKWVFVWHFGGKLYGYSLVPPVTYLCLQWYQGDNRLKVQQYDL